LIKLRINSILAHQVGGLFIAQPEGRKINVGVEPANLRFGNLSIPNPDDCLSRSPEFEVIRYDVSTGDRQRAAAQINECRCRGVKFIRKADHEALREHRRELA
jgi:hypothetical protein